MYDWKIMRLGRVSSTQDVARELALSGENAGLVVVAETQTNGRGSRGRGWYSPKGGLYMTAVLGPMARIGLLPLLAGIAVAETINSLAGIEAELKWPNDILLRGRKVGGVIAGLGWLGNEVKYVLLGIGVNLNNELPGYLIDATSISLEAGLDIDVDSFLRSFMDRLKIHLQRLDVAPQEIVRSWRRLTSVLGKVIVVTDGSGEAVKGVALDVDEDGSLVLETEVGKRRFVSGRLEGRYS